MEENVYQIIREAHAIISKLGDKADKDSKVELAYVSGQLGALLKYFGETGPLPEDRKGWLKRFGG